MIRTAPSPQLLKYAVVACASLICALNLAAAIELSLPQTLPVVLPFSEAFYAHAQVAKDTARRIALARRATEAAPNRAENWLLLANAYQLRDNRLSDRVIGALRRSYRVGPLSPDAHDWRLDYVFSNWRHMPDDLKAAGMAEAEAYIKRYAGRVYLKQLVPTLADGDGRVALGLVLLTAERTGESQSRIAEYRAAQSAALSN